MELGDLIVEVRDGDRVRQGQLAELDMVDFLVVPRANSIGSWSLTLPDRVVLDDGSEVPHELCALLRTPKSGIIVTDISTGDVILSGPMRDATHDTTTEDAGGTWTLVGFSDTVIIAECEAWPQPSNSNGDTQTVANDVRTNEAESLLHDYLNANIGPAASAARKNASLIAGTDLARGPILTRSPRFMNMLELFQSITAVTTLLFDVVQQGTDLVLRTWEAGDLTADVRMDIENGQLASSQYQYSAPGVTHVNVLGQDRGIDRQFRQRTSVESLAAADLWGVRIERTIDQRQTSDTTELDQAGDEVLADEGKTITSLRVVPSEDQLVDFGVGDFISVVIGDQEVPAQVTEKPIAVTAEGLFVGATVGDPYGFDWQSAIESKQASVEARVSAMERNLEIPEHLYSQAQTDAAIAAAITLHQASRRNKVLNGNFRVNQKGYVSGDPMTEKWIHDRWYGSGRLNFCANPVGAVNTTGWNANGHTLSLLSGLTISGTSITTAVRMTFVSASALGHFIPGSAPYVPVIAGRTYTVSMYVRSSVAKTVTMSIQWINANSAGLSSSSSSNVALTANTWTRISLTAVAPAGAFWMGTYSYPTANWAIGNTYDATGVLIEESATLNAYIAPMSVTFTPDVHGQSITVPTGYSIATNLERADVPAGQYTLSWPGTATARIYNSGGSPPGYAASPITVTLDGLADVVIEATDGTIGKVQLEPGSVATPWEPLPLALEFLLCMRYYIRWKPTAINQRVAGIGLLVSTTQVEFIVFTPVPMKGTTLLMNAFLMWTSDGVTANGAVSNVAAYFAANSNVSPNALSIIFTFAAYGAARTPGVLSAQNGTTSFFEIRADF